MKQLFLKRHNHKYKLSKDENGLVKFLHADLKLYFLGWLVGLFQWKHKNIKVNKNLHEVYYTTSKLVKKTNQTSRVYYFHNKYP